MVDRSHRRRTAEFGCVWILLLVTCVFYIAVPHRQPRGSPWRFGMLAEAFLRGELSIRLDAGRAAGPHATDELIPTDDPSRFYCAYPPLPAVVLMPFVWVFGAGPHLRPVCGALGVANTLIFYHCLKTLPRRLEIGALSGGARLGMALFLALGTAAWDAAARSGDWHFAHTVALCGLLLALREYAARDRPLVVGLFLGLAILARPTTALSGLFFALPCLGRSGWSRLVRLAAGPLAALLLLEVYNYARFGSFTRFAYEHMILLGQGKRLMEAYGQFNQVFLFRNFFWFFLAPPGFRADGAFPWLGYDPRGLSLFVASPAMLYALVALGRWREKPAVRHAAIASGLCLVPLLLYFNTGYWQFGHRFSLDYLPLLMILVLVGMGPRPGRAGYTLLVLSIAIHAWGILLDSPARLPVSIWPA